MSKTRNMIDDDENDFVMSRPTPQPEAPAKAAAKAKVAPTTPTKQAVAPVAADELPKTLAASFDALRSAQVAYDSAPPKTRLIALAHLNKVRRHVFAAQQSPTPPDAVSADVKAGQVQPVDASGVLAEIKSLRR